MIVWSLTLFVLIVVGLLVDIAANHPVPMDDRPYAARVGFVLVVAVLMSLPTAIACAIVAVRP